MVFISGNLVGRTEIAPHQIVTKLEEYDYPGGDGDRGGDAGGVVWAIAERECAADEAEQGEEMREISNDEIRMTNQIRNPNDEKGGWVVRWLLIAGTLLFLGVFLGMPLVIVFVEAFAKGWEVYRKAITDSDTWAAIRLTLVTVGVAVPLNMVFGVAAAWCIAKFDFRGKRVLTTLIDLPIAVSPIVAGLVCVLRFGAGMDGTVAAEASFSDHF